MNMSLLLAVSAFMIGMTAKRNVWGYNLSHYKLGSSSIRAMEIGCAVPEKVSKLTLSGRSKKALYGEEILG